MASALYDSFNRLVAFPIAVFSLHGLPHKCCDDRALVVTLERIVKRFFHALGYAEVDCCHDPTSCLVENFNNIVVDD